MRQKFDLQLFAAGDNNDLPARSYQLEFKRLLQAVFKKQSYFADFFGGSIEAMDGIQENETAFYVKTSDIPCVCHQGVRHWHRQFQPLRQPHRDHLHQHPRKIHLGLELP